MSLDPTIKTELNRRLEMYEGRVPHLYLDSLGKVTIGIGHQVSSRQAISGLTLYTSAAGIPGRPATLAEKQAEYDSILKKAKGLRAAGYKPYTTLLMKDWDINQLRDQHISDFHRELGNIYKKARGYQADFDQLPPKVQLALFDMIFNLGASKLVSVFVNFDKAIKAGDWKTAAAQSNRPQVQADRNNYVKTLLLDAAGGVAATGGKVTGKTPGVKQGLLDYLKAVSDHYGKEIHVTSGLRSAADQAEKMWDGWPRHLKHGKIYKYLAANNTVRLELDGYYSRAHSLSATVAEKAKSKQDFVKKVIALAGHLSRHLSGDAVDVDLKTDKKILGALAVGLHQLDEEYQGVVKCHHFDTSKLGEAPQVTAAIRAQWPVA